MIKIVCVGKIKENYIAQGINEFKKRLTPYTTLEIIEIPAYQIKKISDELRTIPVPLLRDV